MRKERAGRFPKFCQPVKWLVVWAFGEAGAEALLATDRVHCAHGSCWNPLSTTSALFNNFLAFSPLSTWPCTPQYSIIPQTDSWVSRGTNLLP